MEESAAVASFVSSAVVLQSPEVMQRAAATKSGQWRDALRSRPLAMGTLPPRSVALQVAPQHARTARTSHDAAH